MSVIIRRAGARGFLLSATVLLVASVLLNVAWLAPTRANAPMQAPTARVCVVDLERVFNSSPKLDSMDAEIQQREEEILALAKAAKSELELLKGELDNVRPDSEEHQRIRRQLVTKQDDLRVQSEKWEREMQSRVLAAKDKLLGEIESVVARVCDETGFDIVLQKEFKIPKTPVTWTTAFYTRPEFDITERVISALK